MADSSTLETKEITSLALNKYTMVISSYGSKSNSVTLILHLKKKKKRKNQQIHLPVALVLKDKLEKKKVLKKMLPPYESWEN